MLWEFEPGGKFVKEWGPRNYAASFAHSVRVDKNDNVWQVDEGSGMVVNTSSAPMEPPAACIRSTMTVARSLAGHRPAPECAQHGQNLIG